ncbi:MAG TPA: fasciclin domain-containing protein [Solirubrobacteraceae bacterium]|nr:fasciclin domain-containing protein [Solirubrobacteraceae bacterium]
MKRILAVLGLTAAVAVPLAAPANAQSGRTIVEVAASEPQFSTLVGLVQKAGLGDTLSSGRLTVFAPTNAAFARVPKATLDALAANPARLRAVLTYHVAQGRLTAANVVRRSRIRTVNGASVRVSVRGRRVFLNRTTRIRKTNIRASNGVVHVIDRVLLPPSR